MHLSNNELNQIIGGGFSAALFNAISRMVTTVYNIGYSIGSTIRRLIKGKACKI